MHGPWVQSHKRVSRCNAGGGKKDKSQPTLALAASAGWRLPRGARAVPLDGGESKMTLNKPYFFYSRRQQTRWSPPGVCP